MRGGWLFLALCLVPRLARLFWNRELTSFLGSPSRPTRGNHERTRSTPARTGSAHLRSCTRESRRARAGNTVRTCTGNTARGCVRRGALGDCRCVLTRSPACVRAPRGFGAPTGHG